MRAFPFLFLLALLSAPAFAALSLQSFSCNSQSGTVAVENGASFNCEAVIKNDGSSETNITSASLSIPSPIWTESATYTGTGYSATVQAGATTTATFSGIRSVLSGPHNFNAVSVTPGGALEADVSSTNINVVSIKTVELFNPASAAQSEQFTVGATVTVGGTMSVDAAIELTGGACSLVSGEGAGKSLGILNNNVPSSTSWAVRQGSSGNCSFTVTASSGAYTPKSVTGTVALGSDVTPPLISSVSSTSITTSSATISWATNEPSTSQVEYGTAVSYGSSTAADASFVTSHSVSLSGLSNGATYHYRVKSSDGSNLAMSADNAFTTLSSGGVSSPAGGGAGGSGGAAVPSGGVSETRQVDLIAPDAPALLIFSRPELSVSEIRLEANSQLTNVSVSIEKLDSRPASIATAPAAEGKVYKYLDISSTVPSANLSRVKIKFKVENTWISSNNFSTSTVYLNRYSSGWNKLPTTFLKSDSTYAYFESESPGFSTFAIVGEKAPASQEQPKPAPIAQTPTGLAPVVSLVTQEDIDAVSKLLGSVVPETNSARARLEQARLKIAEAQTAFNNKEQASAKQLLDEARLLIDEAAGLRSASVAGAKKSIFTILLVLVVLVVGAYAYYSRPPPSADIAELAGLRKEKDTLVQMKKTAEREYLNRRIDAQAYKSMLADYEGRLIEVNTRIDGLSKGNN